MNIGLMFVHEPISLIDNQKKRTDKIIQRKLGSNNPITVFNVYISGTTGPIISFFKNGFSIAVGIRFVFL